MKILALLLAMGFFSGLKSAARHMDDSVMTCVGWAVCLLASLIQMAYVSGGTGQMFWAIVTCVFISQMASVLSLSKPRKWLDLVTVASFVVGWMVMGIDLLTLFIGTSLAWFTYPMSWNYTQRGNWLKRSTATYVVVAVLFGMVIAWVFAHEHFTINIYTVIRWLTH